ncbi:MAG TPA: NAD(P)/FAD-dependent oxidoreductase [Solirubrobacterales bacterium]
MEAASGRSDVVIVGAGFAGLVAARELSRRGHNVVVLEARERLGGRTWTDVRWGKALEMGGTWVHPIQPHVWAEIMRYDVPVARSPKAHDCGWLVGDRCVLGSDQRLDALLGPSMERIAAQAATVFPQPYAPLSAGEALAALDGRSVEEEMRAAQLSEEEWAVADGMWATNFSATLEEGALTQAIRWCALAHGDWRLLFDALATWKLANGTGDLIGRIAADSTARIEPGTMVERVESDGGRVAVAHCGGTIEARAALIAVPVNTLAGIDFRPGLRPGLAALGAERQASHGRKLWIRVEGRVEPFFGYGPGGHPLSLLQYEYEHEGDSLFVAFGSSPDPIDGSDPAAVGEAIRHWLPEARVVDVAEHDWSGDELSLGTWAMLRPGQLSASGPDLYRQEPPVFFAGSDIARGWAGFIDGAIETGLRASAEIDAHLGG